MSAGFESVVMNLFRASCKFPPCSGESSVYYVIPGDVDEREAKP